MPAKPKVQLELDTNNNVLGKYTYHEPKPIHLLRLYDRLNDPELPKLGATESSLYLAWLLTDSTELSYQEYANSLDPQALKEVMGVLTHYKSNLEGIQEQL